MPLNCHTDEILDSIPSLSRFTSLVRWQYVKADYRPVRAGASPQSMVLEDSSGQPLSDKKWAYTAASDGTITIGWILFNHPTIRDETEPVPEWEWELQWAREVPPYVHITGLDKSQPLEFVWFDDRRGVILDRISPLTLGGAQQDEACVQAPGTKTCPLTQQPNRFDKSMAFLIQPVGFTPEKHFAELPNEPICQIVVDPRYTWDEERPMIPYGQDCTYEVKTKPDLDDPDTPGDERQGYYYWNFGHGKTQSGCGPSVYSDWGAHTVHNVVNTYTATPDKISVEIYMDAEQTKRIGGDIVHVTPSQ